MRLSSFALGALTLGVTAFAANFASAAAWVPSSGNTATFHYAAGGDDFGLFGSPTEVNDQGFVFEPVAFRAISFGGTTTIDSFKSDRMYVTVAAANGAKNITQISLTELGDFSINNGGGVKAYAFLSVRVLDAGYGPQTTFTGDDTFTFNTVSDAQGGWDLEAVVNLPTPANRIQIVLNNNLHANSTANGTSIIQKKFVDDLQIYQIPEPTTAAALAGLSVLAFRRRKA